MGFTMEFYGTSACLIIKTLLWYEHITQSASTCILAGGRVGGWEWSNSLFGFSPPPSKATDLVLPAEFGFWMCINVFTSLLIGRIPGCKTVVYVAPSCLVCYEESSACGTPGTTLCWSPVTPFGFTWCSALLTLMGIMGFFPNGWKPPTLVISNIRTLLAHTYMSPCIVRCHWIHTLQLLVWEKW